MKSKKPKTDPPKGPRNLPTRALDESKASSVKGGVKQIIDKYNETAKNMIQSIGR